MSTPICNCPENIGWNPESAWPLTEAAKSRAGQIYCVDGVPVVPPRGGFYCDFGDARQSYTGPTSVVVAAQTFVSAVVGSTSQTLTVTNPYDYPMQFMVNVDAYARVIDLPNDAEFILYTPLKVNGTTVATAQNSVWGGPSAQNQQLLVHFVQKLPQLAVGASMTVSLDLYYSYTGAAGPTWGLLSSAARVWGGTI